MKKTILSLCLFLSVAAVSAQGIRFFEGAYDAALAEAARENKILFIDFYADWCAPCKQMAKTVFTDSVVGQYFAEKIIAVKIDTEKKDNRDLVKKYKVTAMPTLAFVRPNGKVISITAGAADLPGFLRMARIAAGDALSFEDLYTKYRSNPSDLPTAKELLEEAPGYVGSLQGIDVQKWQTRINKVYKAYLDQKMKMDTALINADDYRICYKYNPVRQDDPYLEYVNTHLDAYIAKLGNAPAAYVIEYNNKIMDQLAKAGDEGYKKYLERIRGDMQKAYSLAPVGNIPTYDKFKYYYDGLYILYHQKDVDTYIAHTNRFLEALGDQATSGDYGQACQNMYYATKGNISKDAHHQGQAWLTKALQYPDVLLMDKINMLTMLGDSRKAEGKLKEAREAYNQAYMESLQVDQKVTAASLQMVIKRKLAALEVAE